MFLNIQIIQWVIKVNNSLSNPFKYNFFVHSDADPLATAMQQTFNDEDYENPTISIPENTDNGEVYDAFIEEGDDGEYHPIIQTDHWLYFTWFLSSLN